MITARSLQRPTYTSTHGVNREQWLKDNDEDLRQWYRLTSECVPEDHVADYRDFILVQWDIARTHDECFDDPKYEAALRDADNEDEV